MKKLFLLFALFGFAFMVSAKNPVATIEMADGSKIIIKLLPEKAPNTVANFIYLANKGFYDGTIFHRVIPGFVIQGGDPTGTGEGGPRYSIKGEFNDIPFDRGVVGMARSQHPDSAGSQFFITLGRFPHLDGKYSAFGIVIEGMDVAERISRVPRDKRDKPLTPQVIKKIRVETFGKKYPKPRVIKPPIE